MTPAERAADIAKRCACGPCKPKVARRAEQHIRDASQPLVGALRAIISDSRSPEAWAAAAAALAAWESR